MYLSVEGEKIYRFYRKYEERLLYFLEKTKDEIQEEDIHALRVCIKKLKGIQKLIALLSDDFTLTQHFSPLKRLFKPAGDIRDKQVNLRRLKSLPHEKNLLKSFRRGLKSEINASQEKFHVLVCNFNSSGLKRTRKLVKANCKSYTKHQILATSTLFIRERISGIQYLLENKSEENIHQVRINLKEISTVLILLCEIGVESITPKMLSDLKLFENDFGLWHDYYVLGISLNSYVESNTDLAPEVQKEIACIIDYIAKEENKFIDGADNTVNGAMSIIIKADAAISGTP
jgi:CHAD domain-containing protein